MTDARLRAASRAAAQGDPSARAALLLERVRAGELSMERLQLAAWLGDDLARAVVGPDLVRPQPDALRPWLLYLVELGSREAVVRALVLVGTSQISRRPRSAATAEAVSLFRRWAERPVGHGTLAAVAALLAAGAARSSRRGASPNLLCAWATELACAPPERWVRLARQRLTRWSRVATEDPRPAIVAALRPWALRPDHPINLNEGRSKSRGRMIRPRIS